MRMAQIGAKNGAAANFFGSPSFGSPTLNGPFPGPGDFDFSAPALPGLPGDFAAPAGNGGPAPNGAPAAPSPAAPAPTPRFGPQREPAFAFPAEGGQEEEAAPPETPATNGKENGKGIDATSVLIGAAVVAGIVGLIYIVK